MRNAASGIVPGALRDVTDAVARTVLPNGLTVLSEYMPGVRSVAFGAWVRRATVHERAEEMGISHLLEHLVFKGTQRRTAKELSLALETLGGSLDAFTSREHTSFQARVLASDVKIAADVIGDLLFHPLLTPEDLALEQKVVLEEIAMVEDTPDDLIFDMHNEYLWGQNGYGFPILGKPETVSALTSEAVARLHTQAYRPDNIVVAAAGAIEHDQLLEVLEQTGWGNTTAEATTAAPLPEAVHTPPSYHHMEREGAQTHLVFGCATFAHSDPRRYAFNLVSMLLGGGMSSRLFQRVREELGLAYSVYTFSSFYAETGMHGVYVGTGPETADQAADAVRSELARLAKHGLPAEELAAGKQQLKGQILLALESPSSRMYRAAGRELYSDPARSLDETLALVDAIDEDTVTEVCQHCFAPDSQTIASLGPKPLTG